MKEIVDIIDRTTKEVYHSKKAALTAGDKQLALEVAEGKDIMTVLRTCAITPTLTYTIVLSCDSSSQYEPRREISTF